VAEDEYRIDSPTKLKALAHPLRGEVLQRLSEGPRSAKELADQMGQTSARLTYHLKILSAAGLIEVAETRRAHANQERVWRLAIENFSVATSLIEDPRSRELLQLGASELLDGQSQSMHQAVRRWLDGEFSQHEPFPITISQRAFRTTVSQARYLAARMASLLDELEAEARTTGANSSDNSDWSVVAWFFPTQPGPSTSPSPPAPATKRKPAPRPKRTKG